MHVYLMPVLPKNHSSDSHAILDFCGSFVFSMYSPGKELSSPILLANSRGDNDKAKKWALEYQGLASFSHSQFSGYHVDGARVRLLHHHT